MSVLGRHGIRQVMVIWLIGLALGVGAGAVTAWAIASASEATAAD